MLRKRVAYRRKTDLQICTVDVNRVSVNQDTRELTSDCFFEKLVLPRVQEATKEVTAIKTAADIVKQREHIKVASLEAARKKIGDFITIQDLVIEDVALTKELETAIEAKMVQQQQAEKALFFKQQAETDAQTAIIRANGEAQAIQIQGAALEKVPKLIALKMVEKWNGVSPKVVGAGSGMSVLLPVEEKQ